ELTAKVARCRCRVDEGPIAYYGRSYSEGKKIGWKDGVSAAWTIVRFSVRPDIGREDEGFTTLRRVDALRRYSEFQWELMRPYVGHRVLEVGSGIRGVDAVPRQARAGRGDGGGPGVPGHPAPRVGSRAERRGARPGLEA